jgi:hypothetical protein
MRWEDQDRSDNVEDRRGMPDLNRCDTFRAPAL